MPSLSHEGTIHPPASGQCCTGRWLAGSYIQESGKCYGWFMGDSVHANERGCQIIGRLLREWFKSADRATP